MASVLAEYPTTLPSFSPFDVYDEVDKFRNRWGRGQGPITESRVFYRALYIPLENQTARKARLEGVLSYVTEALADLKPAVPRAASGLSTASEVPFRKSPFARASFEDKMCTCSVTEHVTSSASRTFKTPILESDRLETHQSLHTDGFVCSGASKTRQISHNSGVFHAGNTVTPPPGLCSATLTMSPAPMRPKFHCQYSTSTVASRDSDQDRRPEEMIEPERAPAGSPPGCPPATASATATSRLGTRKGPRQNSYQNPTVPDSRRLGTIKQPRLTESLQPPHTGGSVHGLSKALHSSEEQEIQKTSGSSQNILQITPKRFIVFRWFNSFVCWISSLLLMRPVYSFSRRDCTDKVYSEWYNSLCYVPVNFCGFEQMHSVLVDTAASRGMISNDLARDYNLEITPTLVRIEGFNSDKAPTFATAEAAAHIEYNNRSFQVTLLVLQNPRYPLILPRSMLLAAGIVKFADGVMHEKLPWSDSVMSPLVASRDTRRWRTVRELLFGRDKKVPDQKEVKLRRLQRERSDEEHRREAEDQIIRSIQDKTLRAQRYQQEMRIRETWDLKYKAETKT